MLYILLTIFVGMLPEIFDYEDMCELVALSNDSINRIVNLYLESKR